MKGIRIIWFFFQDGLDKLFPDCTRLASLPNHNLGLTHHFRFVQGNLSRGIEKKTIRRKKNSILISRLIYLTTLFIRIQHGLKLRSFLYNFFQKKISEWKPKPTKPILLFVKYPLNRLPWIWAIHLPKVNLYLWIRQAGPAERAFKTFNSPNYFLCIYGFGYWVHLL